MSTITDRHPFWTGTRVVTAGVVVALVLIAARFGPYLLGRLARRNESTPSQSTGQLRPTKAIEDLVANGLAAFLVDKPPAGEAITPQIRYEQPWPEWLFLAVLVSCIALVVWLYRREGTAPVWAKAVLVGLRLALILLAMMLLSEAVLTVDRTGLPTFAILVDDSASVQIADPFGDQKLQSEAQALTSAAGRDKPDRLAVGLGWLMRDNASFLKSLASQQKLKLYRVSDAAVSVADVDRPDEVAKAIDALKKLDASGSQSRLGDAVLSVLTELRGTPPTAILLLTDGQTTDGVRLSEAADKARKAGVPLFTIGLGDERPARDLALTDLQVDDVVFVGDVVRFVARLSARGFDDAEGSARPRATVHLKRRRTGSTRPDDLESLETVRVPIPSEGKPQTIEIPHKPTEVGTITYVVEVEPVTRELQTDNNRLERTIEVRDQKLRVLYVEGEPRWEYRYVKTYLERDNTVELAVVLQSGDDEFHNQDRSALPAFPAEREGPEGLFSYDVVVLGDVDTTLLNTRQMRDLVEFVTVKGGGLMFLAGEQFNPLAFKGKPLESLLPVRLEDARNPAAPGAGPAPEPFQPALTPEGRANPIFRLGDDEASSREIWESLAPMFWYFEAPRKQPAAMVLAEHPNKQGPEGRIPIILYHYVGAGKALYCAIDETWRWRLRVGDLYFGRYWVQMLRFLARSKMLGQKQAEIITDRRRYTRGQSVQVQVRFLNPGLAGNSKAVAIQLTRPGQAARVLTLRAAPGPASASLFEATVSNLTEGQYTLSYLPPPALSGDVPTALFQVDPPAGEFAHVEMNRPELIAAARLTGGQFYRWNERSKRIEIGAADANSEGTSPQAPGKRTAPSLASDPVESNATRPTGPERTLLEVLPTPQKVPLDTDPPIVLWNTWPILIAFLVIIGTEWFLRKRMQMA